MSTVRRCPTASAITVRSFRPFIAPSFASLRSPAARNVVGRRRGKVGSVYGFRKGTTPFTVYLSLLPRTMDLSSQWSAPGRRGENMAEKSSLFVEGRL